MKFTTYNPRTRPSLVGAIADTIIPISAMEEIAEGARTDISRLGGSGRGGGKAKRARKRNGYLIFTSHADRKKAWAMLKKAAVRPPGPMRQWTDNITGYYYIGIPGVSNDTARAYWLNAQETARRHNGCPCEI